MFDLGIGVERKVADRGEHVVAPACNRHVDIHLRVDAAARQLALCLDIAAQRLAPDAEAARADPDRRRDVPGGEVKGDPLATSSALASSRTEKRDCARADRSGCRCRVRFVLLLRS
jgi:hypothetical protein